MLRQVSDRPTQLRRRRHIAEQFINRVCPDDGQHLAAVSSGMGKIAHQRSATRVR